MMGKLPFSDARVQELIQQLKTVEPPPLIGGWPPAIGFWMLAFLLLVGIALTSIWLWRRYRRQQYRRCLKSELHNAYQQYQQQQDLRQYLQNINRLLRRAVIALEGRTSVVSTHGQQWIDHLSRGMDTPIPNSVAYALTEACYQQSPDLDIPAVHSYVNSWAEQHRYK